MCASALCTHLQRQRAKEHWQRLLQRQRARQRAHDAADRADRVVAGSR